MTIKEKAPSRDGARKEAMKNNSNVSNIHNNHFRVNSALRYAVWGWEVFPAPPNGEKKSLKAARYSNGAKWGKSNDPKVVRFDFSRRPTANIGIATGPDSDIFVLDVDTTSGHINLDTDGTNTLQALEAEHGALPETRTAETPSGGIHLYFKWPANGIVRNCTLAPGLDVRGEGGMVLAPPSQRPGVGVYRWINEVAVADAPAWLPRVPAYHVFQVPIRKPIRARWRQRWL